MHYRQLNKFGQSKGLDVAIIRDFFKAIPVAAILLSSASSAATSQEQTEVASSQRVVKESFDGGDLSLMLGGQISLQGENTPWLVYVTGGKLVMENRQKPQSLHYNDIGWVKYPKSDVLTSTENSVISVTVEGKSVGNGGAGFLVGSGKLGVYVMFSVDEKGRYHILKKDGRKLRSLHRATHPAIVVGAPNQLTFEMRGAHVVFFANGTEIIQIPFSNRAANSRRFDGQTGIGLAAFGIGTFTFDNVEITQGN